MNSKESMFKSIQTSFKIDLETQSNVCKVNMETICGKSLAWNISTLNLVILPFCDIITDTCYQVKYCES